jgi:hypothetical protein
LLPGRCRDCHIDSRAFHVRQQLGRRNQTLEQISYFRGKLYEQMKKANGGDRKSDGKNYQLMTTSQRLPTIMALPRRRSVMTPSTRTP